MLNGFILYAFVILNLSIVAFVIWGARCRCFSLFIENHCPAMYYRPTVRLTMLYLGIIYRASLKVQISTKVEQKLKIYTHTLQRFRPLIFRFRPSFFPIYVPLQGTLIFSSFIQGFHSL